MHSPTSNSDTYLKEGQVAELLGLPVRTLQSWRLRGGGPEFYKIGRSVRYKRADLEEWLASRKASSTASVGAFPDQGRNCHE
ncbi:helix-turn-helix transcriptional regulator [Tepidamorphus sp. 3E244]|uniref:helix-turn-helix transcriptional regulator n=1 Tax=Tepidamorphus sp. 3E244 TaxID=3385498 RepID=UPI0038FC067A